MTWRDEWDELLRSDEHRSWALAEQAKHALAINLYRLRKERGLNQTQLARAAGTRQPNISDLERGDSNPTIETLGKLAAVLGVGVGELLTREAADVRSSRKRKAS